MVGPQEGCCETWKNITMCENTVNKNCTRTGSIEVCQSLRRFGATVLEVYFARPTFPKISFETLRGCSAKQ
jgi:hypothetical protein